MWIERRHDYHFATQARTLAVLSGPGSRNPGHGIERSHVYDLRGGLNAKKASRVSINKVASRRNGRQSVWRCAWADGPCAARSRRIHSGRPRGSLRSRRKQWERTLGRDLEQRIARAGPRRPWTGQCWLQQSNSPPNRAHQRRRPSGARAAIHFRSEWLGDWSGAYRTAVLRQRR